jgi:DNA invertase Pin-like site-specific DNA recombinase
VDNEGASGNSASATLLRNLLASVSQYEKAVISTRILDSNRARRKNKLPCSHAPYGFQIGADGYLVEEPTESSTWNRAIEIRSEPIHSGLSSRGLSWRLVAIGLNEEGHTNRSGNPWQRKNLSQISKWRKLNPQNAAAQ